MERKVEEASIILLIQVRTCRTEFAHFHIPLQVALLRTIEGIVEEPRSRVALGTPYSVGCTP